MKKSTFVFLAYSVMFLGLKLNSQKKTSSNNWHSVVLAIISVTMPGISYKVEDKAEKTFCIKKKTKENKPSTEIENFTKCFVVFCVSAMSWAFKMASWFISSTCKKRENGFSILIGYTFYDWLSFILGLFEWAVKIHFLSKYGSAF